MSIPNIIILGGYGSTGKLVARFLLQESNANLVLAGRSLDKAQAAANELNQEFPGARVHAAIADASNALSLKAAFRGMDFVVVASSTAQYAREIVTAALEAGIDCLDVQYSTRKTRALKALSAEIEQSGRCVITDGGFHPGLPAALVRFAAPRFDRLEKALVSSVIQQDWRSTNLAAPTLDEFLAEINDFEALAFRKGRWAKVNMLGIGATITMDFGSEFGKRSAFPMMLEEMRTLPVLYPSLQDAGFYVGGFNWFVDWLVLPVAMIALKLFPQQSLHPMANWMYGSLKKFSKPPYATILRLEASGIKDDRPKSLAVTLAHPDGYAFTAIPVVACLLQVLDGSARRAGLFTQAHIVEPERFFKDMERMGIAIQIVEK